MLVKLRPGFSGRARHVTISEKAHAKASGKASAQPHMFNGLQETQGSGRGSPGYQILLDLVRPDKGFIFHAQPARDVGDGHEDGSLGSGSEWEAAMAICDLASDCHLEEESVMQIF